MAGSSIVRGNLMYQQGYRPYCGSNTCKFGLVRTKWDKVKEQFTCSCGWVSQYDADFIKRYKEKWNL